MRMSGQSDMPAIVGINGRLLVKFTKPATREHPFMYHCHVLEHEDAGMMGQYTCT
jgi:FtsP/CotA-like multicopper oxidase with cupredoxin domain